MSRPLIGNLVNTRGGTMSDQAYLRRLAAILSADAVGYSRLMRADEQSTVRAITSCRAAITHLVQQYRGRVVDSPGDNLLAEFNSVVDAVNCAVEVQRDLERRNAELPGDRRMPFRIGLNLGDVLEDGSQIYGDGVNVAARMESLAQPGGICLSGAVHDAVASRIGLEYEFIGEKQVKNIDQPVRVYRVVMQPIEAANPPEPESELALPDKPSIAVLPFVNMSGDPEQEYFCDGISEEIITALSKIPELFVIARNSSFVYKGKPVNVQQVGRELGVGYVLEGSVRRGGDRLRVTAQLIDARTGRHVWAERYDRPLEDIFALQDEITLRIIFALDLNLLIGDQALAYQRTQTRDLDSVMKIFQARAYIYRGDKESYSRCLQLCEQVVAKELPWSLPYGLLGLTHVNIAMSGWSEDAPLSLQKAFECANQCMRLDELNPMGHGLLALIYAAMRQYDQSLTEGKMAVDLAPGSADAYGWYSMALTFAGEPAKAINMMNTAMRLNPFPPAWYLCGMGMAFNHLGDYGQALSFLKRALATESTMRTAHLAIAGAYAGLGRIAEAKSHAQELIHIDPEFTLDSFRQTNPHKDRDYCAQIVDALRLAGLK